MHENIAIVPPEVFNASNAFSSYVPNAPGSSRLSLDLLVVWGGVFPLYIFTTSQTIRNAYFKVRSGDQCWYRTQFLGSNMIPKCTTATDLKLGADQATNVG